MLAMLRLLLDPTAVDGGSAAAAETPPPVAMRQIAATDYEAMVRQLGEFETFKAQQAAELATKEHARLVALAEKGQAVDAIRESNESWQKKLDAQLERYRLLDAQVLGTAKADAFRAAFAGRTFAGETPEDRQLAQADVARLLEADFEPVRESDGRIVVREKATGRPAGEALKERLDGRRFARFLASNGGGTQATDANGGGPPNDALDKNAAAFKARQVAGSMGLHRLS